MAIEAVLCVLFNVLKLPQPPNAKSFQSGMCSTDKKVCLAYLLLAA